MRITKIHVEYANIWKRPLYVVRKLTSNIQHLFYPNGIHELYTKGETFLVHY